MQLSGRAGVLRHGMHMLYQYPHSCRTCLQIAPSSAQKLAFWSCPPALASRHGQPGSTLSGGHMTQDSLLLEMSLQWIL